jgi:hypothetical protein
METETSHLKTLTDIRAPKAQIADHISNTDTSQASQTPSMFGPHGSGYKDKDKSPKDYSAASAIYDYLGSYTRLGRGKGRQPPNGDSDSDDDDDLAGGGGPPDRHPNGKANGMMARKAKGEPHELYFESKWACVSFAQISPGSILLTTILAVWMW